MAIKRPDIYEHNNVNLAISDTDFHRGGFRSAVASMDDLYALSGKTGYSSAPGQLKEYSTIVYVSGETKYYVLTDIDNVGNASGWSQFQTGGGGAGTITGATNGIVLANTGTTVALGGSLTGNTLIDASAHTFTIPNVSDFQVKTSGDTTVLGLDNEGFLLQTTGGSVTFDDGGGLKYDGDYSSGYTATSIPDVQFVTGQTGSYLRLDQTSQQNVTGSQPVFDEGIEFGSNPSALQTSGHTAGRAYYDKNYETISVDIGSETTLQLGQEDVRYVYNDTGAVINDGQVVRDTGVHNTGSVNTVTVGLAIASGITTSNVIGIATQDIGINDYGYITTRGNINGLNTDTSAQYSGMTEGNELYLSESVYGGITNVAPVSPYVNVRLGRLLTKDVLDGKIFVEIHPALGLNDLTDVSVPSPSLDNVLKWNGNEWVNGAIGATSAGSGVNVYYATPVINSVTSPAGISEDGTSGNGIQVATLSRTPITTGGTQVVAGLSPTDLRAFSAWMSPNEIRRTKIDSGLWEFYDYVSVDSAAGETYLIHQMHQIIHFTGSTITITGAGANSRTATITSGEFGGEYFNPSAINTEASYLQTESGLYQITASASTNSVTITVPTGYVNETAVTGGTWNPLFSGSTTSIEDLTTTLYQTKIISPAFDVAPHNHVGELVYVSASNSITLTLNYNGTSEGSFIITPLVTLHNELAGLQGGIADERYHISQSQVDIVNNTSGINTGDETKSSIEGKLTDEILTHWHPYSGLTGAPDLNQYQSVSGFTGYTATTQPIIDGAITGATNVGTGATVYSGTTGRNLNLHSIIGTGGTTVQKVGDEIVVSSLDAGGSQQYSGETPTAVCIGGIDVGYELTGKTLSCIIQDMFVPELCGTITNPSIGINLTHTGILEIGCIIDQTVTGNYNQGCINPQYCSVSDKRNLTVNAYEFTGSGMPSSWQVCSSLSANETVTNHPVSSGSQSWTVCARYDSGTTALSSKGSPYGAVPVSGCTNVASGSVTGILPWYWGTHSSCTITSDVITGGTKTVANVGSSTPITYNATTEYLWFAAPACASTKTKWWVCAANAGNIGGVDELWAAPCNVIVSSGQGCWGGCNFDVYVTCGITSTASGIPMCLYI